MKGGKEEESDLKETFTSWKAAQKLIKEVYAIDCPGCIKEHPKRHPSKLLPGQTCKWCFYRDYRPRIPEEDIEKLTGWKRVYP